MRIGIIFCCLFFITCEQVVQVILPEVQNLTVVEGILTDRLEFQQIKLSKTNSFTSASDSVIRDASVFLQSGSGTSVSFLHSTGGIYVSPIQFRGVESEEYRIEIVLSDGARLISDWEKMSAKTIINDIQIDSFKENDPNNLRKQITINFPRITARDSIGTPNFYRWVFFRNDVRVTTPEFITVQDDKFFDGNLIPNTFDEFSFEVGEEVKVELQSINAKYHAFLSLLKAQFNTFRTTSPTTPAFVNGNIKNILNPDELVLGFFGTVATSTDSLIVI